MSYPWKDVSPKDTIRLTKSSILSDLDNRTLTSLYQPLIGSRGISLYMILKEYVWHEHTKEVRLSDVLSQLDCGVKEYYEARIQLEAYGLIKIYQHTTEKDNYQVMIEAPLSPTHFFNDPMLKMLLVEKIGQRLAKELEERFVYESTVSKEYQDITKSFLDVVHIDMSNDSQAFEGITKAQNNLSQSLSNEMVKDSHFDWSFFVEGMDKQFVNTQSLNKEIKKLIYTFHTIYGINELDMQRFILEASDISTGDVNEKKLISIIQNNYLHSSNKKDYSTELIKEDTEKPQRTNELKQRGFSDSEIEVILHAEQTKPYSYLKSIKQQKGGFVTSNETWLLKELVEQSPLKVSVINILINYILIIKNAPTLEKNLATKIANDWAQNDVQLPEDAMEKVKKLYEANQTKNKKKPQKSYKRTNYNKGSNRVETLPSWASEASSSDERISDEEEQAFKEKLRKIRNRKSGED